MAVQLGWQTRAATRRSRGPSNLGSDSCQPAAAGAGGGGGRGAAAGGTSGCAYSLHRTSCPQAVGWVIGKPMSLVDRSRAGGTGSTWITATT